MAARRARFGDIPAIVELMQESHRRSKYRNRGAIVPKLAKSVLLNTIQRHGLTRVGGACVFVTENDGVLDGFIIGVLELVYSISDKLSANDLFFYVSERGLPQSAGHLLDAFIERNVGIDGLVQIQMGATDAIQDYERTAKLYRLKGFVQTGVIYEMRMDG